MRSFFATCVRGLESILATELQELGASAISVARGGVAFSGDVSIVYQANLWLRTAVRVLMPVVQAEVKAPSELYDLVRTVDWSEFLTPERTLAVDCNVRDSTLTHSQYAARVVKDAICDQFREKTGRRPSVNVESPALGLNLHIHHNVAILSLDSSWHSLHKRGYRPIQTRAPLNEALAAGLLLHAGYDPVLPIVDPMCGSGTFLIEAAWIALRRPPGLTRKWFGFMGWPDFDPGVWSAIRDHARQTMPPRPANRIVGSDLRQDAVHHAARNIKTAGIGHLVDVRQSDFQHLSPPTTVPGLIICNPPYGERLGHDQELIALYQSLGMTIRRHWPGWRFVVFTAADHLAQQIRLKPHRVTAFFNGSLKCRLWEFEPT